MESNSSTKYRRVPGLDSFLVSNTQQADNYAMCRHFNQIQPGKTCARLMWQNVNVVGPAAVEGVDRNLRIDR